MSEPLEKLCSCNFLCVLNGGLSNDWREGHWQAWLKVWVEATKNDPAVENRFWVWLTYVYYHPANFTIRTDKDMEEPHTLEHAERLIKAGLRRTRRILADSYTSNETLLRSFPWLTMEEMILVFEPMVPIKWADNIAHQADTDRMPGLDQVLPPGLKLSQEEQDVVIRDREARAGLSMPRRSVSPSALAAAPSRPGQRGHTAVRPLRFTAPTPHRQHNISSGSKPRFHGISW